MNQPLNISKITLGTVQLGTNYGVANKSGQPATTYSHQLLQFALDKGISALDTARIYGNSEEVIGSFSHADDFSIISKFKLSNAALENPALAICEAMDSFIISAKKLNRSCIPVYLFHKDSVQEMSKVARTLPTVLRALKKEGMIMQGGISVYTPAELNYIDDWEHINAVQVPMNLLDTRLLQNNLMQRLIENHVNVFIRSIYLQGLLLMKEEDLSSYHSHTVKYLQKIKAIAELANKSISDLAFSFIRDTPGITSLVVGVETIEQLDENIRLLSSPTLTNTVYEEIKHSFTNIPETIITPALWSR